jgi:hypothetical protein
MAAIAFATCSGVTRKFPCPMPNILLSCGRIVPWGFPEEIIPGTWFKFRSVWVVARGWRAGSRLAKYE